MYLITRVPPVLAMLALLGVSFAEVLNVQEQAQYFIDFVTGPIALSLSALAIVVAGTAHAATDGNKAQLYQVTMGVAIAIFALQIVLLRSSQ